MRVCVCVCIGTRPRCPHIHMHMSVLWAGFCPVYFSLPDTLRLPSTTLAISSQPTHTCTGRKSVDQWSRVPTGTVVVQIAPIAAVMNATSDHTLQRTTPNPLSCPGLTPCVSSQSPRRVVCANPPMYSKTLLASRKKFWNMPLLHFMGWGWVPQLWPNLKKKMDLGFFKFANRQRPLNAL